MINIPNETKSFAISNTSDLLGNLYVVKGMNFDNEGYITLSNAVKACINESQDANFDQATVIVYNGDLGNYFFQTWDEPYNVDVYILAQRPVEDTGANNPTGDSTTDATWFGDKLVVTMDTDVRYYDSPTNAWVDTNISLTAPAFSNYRHVIENFRNLGYVAIANVNSIGLYSAMSATPTLVRTLNLPSDQTITGMKYFNQNLYIATQSPYGEDAFIYVWNGTGTAYQSAFKVDATEIFDIEVYKDNIIIFASNGAIYQFNGSGFSILCALPIFYTDIILTSIRHNVLKSNGDVFYLSFSDGSNDDKKLLNQPDGIWCYEPKVGFYCKYPFSISTTIKEDINTSAVDTGTGQITVTNDWATGTEVFYRGGSPTLTPLVAETKYFVIRVDATHIKLATTLANANNGTAITLTSTGVNGQDFVFFPKTDYGQFFTTHRPAALTTIDINQSYPQYGMDVIWSAELGRRTADTSTGYLGSTSPSVESRGYIITPKITSAEITDQYNTFVLKWTPLQSELDKIIVKYRTIDDVRNYINMENGRWVITWTSSTTFTTTQSDWEDAEEGYEVEILRGAGAGLLAHITSITENTGTYTVTIDETFGDYVSGDVGVATFRNFLKLDTITTSNVENTEGYKSIQIGKRGKFIQFKIECRGIDVKIEEIKVDNKYFAPVRK